MAAEKKKGPTAANFSSTVKPTPSKKNTTQGRVKKKGGEGPNKDKKKHRGQHGKGKAAQRNKEGRKLARGDPIQVP